MFVISEAEAAAVRAIFEQRGEFAAAVELRRLFPAVTDNAQARECARAIAGCWTRKVVAPINQQKMVVEAGLSDPPGPHFVVVSAGFVAASGAAGHPP